MLKVLSTHFLSCFIISASFTASSALPLVAQTAEVPEKACRCCSLDRFYAPWMKTLERPPLRKKLGDAELKITTKSDKAQEYFNQGLNCLHGFWEFEAYRYFLAAIEEDPDCAMAYWGVCMSLPSNNSEAGAVRKKALKKAQELAASVSKHEQLYIQSASELIYSGAKISRSTLEEIVKKHPDDMNALGLLAYWTKDGHDPKGQAKRGTLKAIKLLEDGLKLHPENLALIHYYVHTVETGPNFRKAEPYLKTLAENGASISHLLHMPGHIYFLNGDYGKAIVAFEQCYALEKSYFEKEKITPGDHANYTHNLHFWAKTLAENDNYSEAIKIAKLLTSSISNPKRKNAATSQNNYLAATIECFIHMRFKEYGKATESISLESVEKSKALYHYLTALKLYCEIKAELANPEGDANVIYEKGEALQDAALNLAAAAKNEPGSVRETAKASMLIKVFQTATKLWQMNLDKNTTDLAWAEFLLEDDAKYAYMEPPLLPCLMAEEIGDLCLRNSKPQDAIKYYEIALKKRPKSVHLYRLLSQAHKVAGNEMKSAEYEKLAKP